MHPDEAAEAVQKLEELIASGNDADGMAPDERLAEAIAQSDDPEALLNLLTAAISHD